MEENGAFNPKQLYQLLEQRRSVRKYRGKSVSEEELNFILASANRAPSAGNLQPYEIYVVTDETQRKKLAAICLNQQYIAQAPVVLVFCTDAARSAAEYGKKGEELFALQDATIATAYAQLAAAALGLGTVWIGAFDEEPIVKLLNLRKGICPVAVLPVGHPDEVPEPTTRRKLDDLVHRV